MILEEPVLQRKKLEQAADSRPIGSGRPNEHTALLAMLLRKYRCRHFCD